MGPRILATAFFALFLVAAMVVTLTAIPLESLWTTHPIPTAELWITRGFAAALWFVTALMFWIAVDG